MIEAVKGEYVFIGLGCVALAWGCVVLGTWSAPGKAVLLVQAFGVAAVWIILPLWALWKDRG